MLLDIRNISEEITMQGMYGSPIQHTASIVYVFNRHDYICTFESEVKFHT